MHEGQVFDRFPHGIVVFGPTGGLLEWNGAAERLLGPPRPPRGGPVTRCCELFGCGTLGVLEGTCLSDLARRGPTPSPEIRVDLPARAAAQSAWVTVASLDNEGRWVAEVRQAAPGDRRRRTQLNWISEPRLHVYALGRTRIESREGDLGGPWLNQRAGQLFKYLVSERQREVAADEIAEAIWPKSDPRILTTVRYFIHRLRRELEPEPPDNGPSSFISSNKGGYRLERGAVWVDADEFEQKVKVGLAALSNGNEHLLEEAIDLYQGDFLADEPYAVWSVRERDRLRLLAERSLLGLIEHRLRQGDKKGALRHMRSLAELEPYDIAIHRDLIETCLACGRRGEAIRRYSELRTRFREEFGEDLNLQLSDLPLGDRLAGGWR